MELKIISDSENKAASRRDIELYVLDDAATPKKADLKTELCKKLNLSPDSTVIVRIDQSFGARQCRAVAHSYPSSEAMNRFEQRHLLDRKGKKKGAAKAEAKPAAGAEEKK